jgi:hypothetical protein
MIRFGACGGIGAALLVCACERDVPPSLGDAAARAPLGTVAAVSMVAAAPARVERDTTPKGCLRSFGPR